MNNWLDCCLFVLWDAGGIDSHSSCHCYGICSWWRTVWAHLQCRKVQWRWGIVKISKFCNFRRPHLWDLKSLDSLSLMPLSFGSCFCNFRPDTFSSSLFQVSTTVTTWWAIYKNIQKIIHYCEYIKCHLFNLMELSPLQIFIASAANMS